MPADPNTSTPDAAAPNASTSDAGTPVYFDLALDRELPKVPTGIGGIRVGDRR